MIKNVLLSRYKIVWHAHVNEQTFLNAFSKVSWAHLFFPLKERANLLVCFKKGQKQKSKYLGVVFLIGCTPQFIIVIIIL